MRIAINLGPNADWDATLSAAQTADRYGFDALSFLDHYHTEELQYPYICGWSVYGALAMVTSRISLVPMVIDRLNYLPGVLAKESATLAIASGGRFELGIGAGDFFEEMRAWGISIPKAPARIAGLQETITVLRRIWRGEQVTFEGEHLSLRNAASTPVPPQPMRVVVGAGSSKRLISSAVEYADEINVYSNDDIIRFAKQAIEASHRSVRLSVYASWDLPEEDIAEKLAAWEQLGVGRTFLTFWPPFDKIPAAVKYMS
jgi:alkanesulfonate monooxygenase SsuD/methylene tetrahydromethanopterin reductase-like flavin-dependent oxidoreductase (luciferase family)